MGGAGWLRLQKQGEADAVGVETALVEEFHGCRAASGAAAAGFL
jgi:hypothetical protein